MLSKIKSYAVISIFCVSLSLHAVSGYLVYNKFKQSAADNAHLSSLVDILGHVVEQRTTILLKNDHALAQKLNELLNGVQL